MSESGEKKTLVQLQEENTFIVTSFLLMLLIYPMVSNLIQGVYERGLIQLACLSLLLFCLYLSYKKIYRLTRDLLLIFSIYSIAVVSLITNGGLYSSVGMVALPAFILLCLACTGLRRSLVIMSLATATLIAMVIMDQSEVFLGFEDRSVGGGSLFLGACFFSIYLLVRYQIAQHKYLLEVIESREDTLREVRHAREVESRFLANMSHEIRNPLNGVLGLIQVSSEEHDPLQIKKNLRAASLAGEHLHHIVDDILTYKKIEEKELIVNARSTDVHDLISQWALVFEPLAAESGLDYELMFDRGKMPRFLIFDKKLVGQILTNLISNAIKFTPGNGKVVIEFRFDSETLMLTIEVTDTGLGMTQPTLETLFVRFKQAEDSTEKNYQGTGLGLAITDELVRLLGGKISVESSFGVGSKFTVELPVELNREYEAEGDPSNVAESGSRDTSDLSALHILCVDDSRVNLVVLKSMLEKHGARVSLASSAMEAYEFLSISDDVMLVLTDISMPEIDGVKLQRMIAREHRHLPVVAVTGNVLESDLKNLMDHGFQDVLQKPVDSSRLVQTVKTLCLE